LTLKIFKKIIVKNLLGKAKALLAGISDYITDTVALAFGQAAYVKV